jgi:polyisoprenoid-binding protein YceI
MKRGVLVASAIALVVVIAGVGGYLYFFSGLRSTPDSLVLSPSVAGTSTPLASLSGHWQLVRSQSTQAGYRVNEQFAEQALMHEAVARTSDVTGEVTVGGSGDSLSASELRVTVGLTNLRSVDTVAGRDVTQRDSVVQRALQTSQYPEAIFEAAPLALPKALGLGSTVEFDAPGRLTVHGVSRDVPLHMQGRLDGATFEMAGSTKVNMTDYGVEPPSLPFVKVGSIVVLELRAGLQRTSA